MPELPIADKYYEQIAARWFAEGHTPEKWLALHGHSLILGSNFAVRYADGELHDWMHRVGALIEDPAVTQDMLRKTHLTRKERRAVKRQARSESTGRI